MDALAVSLATRGTHAGVAPLGTSLTEEQAAQLARISARTGTSPLVATDADLAGQIAAQRDYWLLAQHGVTPATVTLRPGSDPASLLESAGPEALRAVLDAPRPLAEVLVEERLDSLTGREAAREAVRVLAAGHPDTWHATTARVAQETGLPPAVIRRELARALQQWDRDPRAVVAESVGGLSKVRARTQPPSETVTALRTVHEPPAAVTRPPRPTAPTR